METEYDFSQEMEEPQDYYVLRYGFLVAGSRFAEVCAFERRLGAGLDGRIARAAFWHFDRDEFVVGEVGCAAAAVRR